MARELAISIYLFVFRFFFSIFKLFPQKKKTVFIASFGDNILFTLRELEKLTDEQAIILRTSQCNITFKDAPNRKQYDFKTTHPVHWIWSIYHLATSRIVFVDNYY